MEIKDPYMLKATLTADGRPWVQRCYVCGKSINYLKMRHGVEFWKVGELVRHRKCNPLQTKEALCR